jgi:uncharacterized membrane protein (UPF0136 family)
LYRVNRFLKSPLDKKKYCPSSDGVVFLFTLLGVFFLPLKLSLAYGVLIPLLCYWAWSERQKIQEFCRLSFVAPILFFLLSSLLSSLWGINPIHSITGIIRFAFFTLTLLLVFDVCRKFSPFPVILALITGQSISSLYSLLTVISPFPLPRLFLGAVTASGQLCMTSIIAVGFVLWEWKRRPFEGSSFAKSVCVAVILLLALLANLKRGPWVGVFSGLVLLFVLHERRLLLPLILGGTIAALSIPSVRERLAESDDHFFISGGRNIIWQIGAELSSRYPVGIGYRNSPILRDFSDEIPQELRHFHNNFLNILVENGWLTLGIYLWWITALLQLGFSKSARNSPHWILISSLGCGIVSWQIAGLVEYNVGDSEVMLVSCVIIGVLGGFAIPRTVKHREETDKIPHSEEKSVAC